ncbi:MAG: phosphoethanolamine--lipid A transferase [Pseudomonadota bacterium]
MRWPSLSRRPISTDVLVLCTSVLFAVAYNGAFVQAMLAGRAVSAPGTWGLAAALGAFLVALHVLLLGLVTHVWTARPLLSVLIVAAAASSYFIGQYGVFIDPTMLRNVLHTQPSEARELLGAGFWAHLALAAVPLMLLWRVRLTRRSVRQALARRAALLFGSVAVAVLALLSVYQDVASEMRNRKELRYLVTPANVVYSTARVLAGDARVASTARRPVGTDARLAAAAEGRAKPALFVIVVGETARAANWGLNGHVRQTTPELAKLDVLNFSNVSACGTNTETSLPCMFSAVGRRDYDEARIRGSESLLHVLRHAGLEVLWRDNQSGCKGVCEGLPTERLDQATVPGLCEDGRCFDEVLLHGLDTIARDARGNLVVVLHMIGNHGPAYHRRYPKEFARFAPACETDDLRRCSSAEIAAAYDNALLYTDHVLARVIGFLKEREARYDTAMLYVSDHGESLGEHGLYLHGVPYAIAPREQLQVPMVWWLSPGFAASAGVDTSCLRARTGEPWTHDHLFHTVLGLLQVQTAVYEPAFDIGASCRAAPPAP